MEQFDDFKKASAPQVRNNGPLTTRERQIIHVLAEGLTNKEIARRLKLAEGTVKVHLHRIFQKLEVANRTALAILAHTVIL
jgi:DNA-binding NarL/FixJ family response regulator